MNPVAFTATSSDDYDNMYEYDPYGYTQSYGAAESYAFANMFRAQRNEVISGVGFYCTNPNAYYTIEIYKNSDYLDLPNATPVYVQTGYQGLSGYYTIPLVNPVPVDKNDYFAAVIKMTTPGRWYPVAVEIPIDGYSSAATSWQGQSYISRDGVYWEDFAQIYPNGNVCLKIFTNSNAGSRILPFPDNRGGYYPPPNDLNGDGKYEDIDGNYILDYNDVDVLFENLEFAMTNQPVLPFDFDGNGFIGYGDVSALFEMVWR
jgi:PKD repeat protein